MSQRSSLALALMCAVSAAPALHAQTSTPGAGVDVEVVDPTSGGNEICVPPGDTFWAHVFVRPGSTAEPCTLACGSTQGGTAAVATAVLDLLYEPDSLVFEDIGSNPSSAAADGLEQLQNLSAGRIGWALAGDWTPDATPSPDTATLADPCSMGKLTGAGWVFRVMFTRTAPAPATLHLRRSAADGFPLSFADACGRAFREDNGLVDEVVDATVRSDCGGVADIVFRNGFETGDPAAWRGAA